ncbi:MAG: hypothetical protein E7167_00840 [Firmicutes bacterium]|nr:hypothetical protein [Bacillota bacterium]
MHYKVNNQLLDNPKLLSHFMEHSYWIKELNRRPEAFKEFQKQMKIIYKERPTDKINSAIDNVEMIASIIDATK